MDDDAVSLELLCLLLARGGYEVSAADSGDAALLYLRGDNKAQPDVVLADLQMPGVAGGALFRQLRAACGAATVLLAMSGGAIEESLRPQVNGFLLKPFTIKSLAAAIEGEIVEHAEAGVLETRIDVSSDPSVLNESIYTKLASSMAAPKLAQLYALCLTDAKMRIAAMRSAASDDDDRMYRRQAHGIRGGCGMVGAVELHTRAASMEERGLSDANHVASLAEFLSACERLQRILIARTSAEIVTYLPGEDTR